MINEITRVFTLEITIRYPDSEFEASKSCKFDWSLQEEEETSSCFWILW